MSKSKSKQHPYSILSVRGTMYVPLNFSWPSDLVPGEGAHLLTTQECTLLQKMLRYRSQGPILLKEQQAQGKDLERIPLLFSVGEQRCSLPTSLTTHVTSSMTKNHFPPLVRCVTQLSATFSTKEACEEARQDIERAIGYECLPHLALYTRVERRNSGGLNSEDSCSCVLKSVYQDTPFYAERQTCSRHVQNTEQVAGTQGRSTPSSSDACTPSPSTPAVKDIVLALLAS